MKIAFYTMLTCVVISFTSCGDKKVDQALAQDFRKEYESLSKIHKEIELEQKKITIEKDTLVEKLREVKGALNAEVEDFNERYRGLLLNQNEIVSQHYNVLGEIAQLEDDVLKNKISKEEAIQESESIIIEQKAVYNLFQKSLETRDSLLKEYELLIGGKASLSK